MEVKEPQKKIIKIKLGQPIPFSAKLIKSEVVVTYERPPIGGDKQRIETEYFYYEVPA